MSADIVRDLWRDGLRTGITDPMATERAASAANSRFVLTGFPDRGVYYPHIVVEEANSDLDRIDTRGDLQAGDFDVRVSIYGETKTHVASLKDQVRKWAIVNRAALQVGGYVETRLISSQEVNWDDTSKVLRHDLIYRGLVHAT